MSREKGEGSLDVGCRHQPQPHRHRGGVCDYAPQDDRPKNSLLTDQSPPRDDDDGRPAQPDYTEGSALADLFDSPDA